MAEQNINGGAPIPEAPMPEAPMPEAPTATATQANTVGTIHTQGNQGTITKQTLEQRVQEELRAKFKLPFELADKQGRWSNKPAIGSALMYINSEVNEAHTAFASKHHANADDIKQCQQFLAEGKTEQFVKYFKAFVKSTFEDELADIILMTASLAGYYGVDLFEHVMLKHKYNALRDEHSAIHQNE